LTSPRSSMIVSLGLYGPTGFVFGCAPLCLSGEGAAQVG
jgi:hypothetical protein